MKKVESTLERKNGTNKAAAEQTFPEPDESAAALFSPYQVQVSNPYLNIRKGPGTDYEKIGKYTGAGVFTIVKEEAGKGSSVGWGLLESHAEKQDGWVSLEHTERI